MNEITIITTYEQAGKFYCEDCKPQGRSKQGTLVVSGYDHFCAGCGEDFKDKAECEEREQAAWDNHQMGY